MRDSEFWLTQRLVGLLQGIFMFVLVISGIIAVFGMANLPKIAVFLNLPKETTVMILFFVELALCGIACLFGVHALQANARYGTYDVSKLSLLLIFCVLVYYGLMIYMYFPLSKFIK